MSAMEFLSNMLGIDTSHLSQEEILILETELFARIYDELIRAFQYQYHSCLYLISLKKEFTMPEENLVRRMINDILLTEEYSLSGIAHYTQIPQDIIYEIARGCNTSPTLALPRKVIELHRAVRPDLYKKIIEKIKLDVGLLAV